MNEELFVKSGKRGRPQIVLNFPKQGRFNINDLVALNPHVKCRLSVYTHAHKLVKKGILRYTGKTIKTGGVGKPLDEFESMASFRRTRTLKRNNKLRKLANKTVNLTSESAPVNAPVTEPVPAAV